MEIKQNKIIPMYCYDIITHRNFIDCFLCLWTYDDLSPSVIHICVMYTHTPHLCVCNGKEIRKV